MLETRSDVSSLVARLEQLSINLVKLSETVSKGAAVPYSAPKAYENKVFPRTLVCFHCGKSGHKKWDCTLFLTEEKNRNSSMVTGANAIPVNNNRINEDNSGKAQEHLL